MPLDKNLYESVFRDFSVSRETFEKLSIYHDQLIKWQKSINLVGPSTLDNIWERHFKDSIQLLPLIKNDNSIKIDLGSGAGFPGLLLAICGIANIQLIESDGKKIVFMKEVARLTETKIEMHQSRIESVSLPTASYIFSRALADVSSLLRLSTKFVSHGTICLFHKGKNWANEIEDAKKNFEFSYEALPSVTDSEGVILKLSDIQGWCHDQEIPDPK